MDFTKDLLEIAHKQTVYNQSLLSQYDYCGCISCLEILRPEEIEHWIDGDPDGTALCPHCLADTVLPPSEDYPLTDDFLKAMHKHYCATTIPLKDLL